MFEPSQYFLDVMRAELGIPTLDMIWLEDRQRLRVDPRDEEVYGFNEGEQGCWAVTMRFREFQVNDVGTHRVMCSAERENVIMMLDGNHGNPLTPGRWVIDALKESDMASRGVKVRTAEVNEWRKGKVAAAAAGRRDFAREMAHDDMLYRGLKRKAEELGTTSLLKEELRDMEKAAEDVAIAREEQDNKDIREADYGHPG